MLELRDIFHLPQVDELFEAVAAAEPGLVVVAGPDPRPAKGAHPARVLLPGGRTGLFHMLVDRMVVAHPRARCLVVAQEAEAVRIARPVKRRVERLLVEGRHTYAERIEMAVNARPGLLVIDRLTTETVPLALKAAKTGLCVLTQLDTVFWGSGAVRHLLDLGAFPDQLEGLAWVISVQRMAALCNDCKQPTLPDPQHLERLQSRYTDLADLLDGEFARRWARFLSRAGQPAGPRSAPDQKQTGTPATPVRMNAADWGEVGTFFYAPGCEHCGGTGRSGDLAVFDFLRCDPQAPDPARQTSRLPMDQYVLQLACLGRLPLEDTLDFEGDQFRRTFALLASRDQELAEADASTERKLAELEAANRVLQQRTRTLVSLQELSQALIAADQLDELAGRICRSAMELCRADHVVVYYRRPEGRVEILAASGWEPSPAGAAVDGRYVLVGTAFEAGEPVPYNGWPPGVPPPPLDADRRFSAASPAAPRLRAGLWAPLSAQGERVGAMIVQSTEKLRFTPGEAALLQSLANSAALAVQRAGLVEALRAKIGALEAAQAELERKHRLESELELARQVQQSVLPRSFPTLPGFRFAAHNEPARQVGGDFYDVIDLHDGTFGLAIGDVSDKGLPAALYMTLARSLLRAEARRERSPRQVAESVNTLLEELGEARMFVTLFYGVVDSSSRRLSYACAGHDHPLLIRNKKVLELDSYGAPLGILPGEDLNLTEQSLDLLPGDRVVFYTDGFLDALSPNREMFGTQRLHTLLLDRSDLEPDALCKAIFAGLADFRAGADPYDDMALLVLEVGS